MQELQVALFSYIHSSWTTRKNSANKPKGKLRVLDIMNLLLLDITKVRSKLSELGITIEDQYTWVDADILVRMEQK